MGRRQRLSGVQRGRCAHRQPHEAAPGSRGQAPDPQRLAGGLQARAGLMPLKIRLPLLYLALAAPVLVIVGAVVYLATRSEIIGSVDDSLRSKTQAVEAALERISEPLSET